MSLDLMREFGSQSQNPRDNPWADTVGQKQAVPESTDDDDDFGDFEVPDDQTSANKQWQCSRDVIGVTDPSSDLSSVGELVDLSDGSYNRMESLIPQASATITISERSHSLSGRRAEDQSMLINASHSQLQGASIISEKPLVPETLEDEDWDKFVEYSIPSAADQRSTQKDNLRTQNVDFNRQPRKPSSSLSNSLEASEEVTASLASPTNIERIKPPRPVETDCLGSPPSNIPPPSILLLLIETMFQSLLADIRKIILSTDASTLSLDQSKVDQIQVHLLKVRAATRIIAGRKLRWKRDTHLSQSMKIGPAHSDKTGGMKLTGMDRTESLREDREVAEALSTWKKQLGGLRAAITMANAEIRGTVLSVPHISDNLQIRGAKIEEGAMTAPKCCFVCGLRREERLEKIEVDVEDSFGEWWTDHWGHLDCRIFWERHKGSLEQRR